MNAKPMPSAELVRSLFNYDPNTGKLTWKVRPSRRTKPGDEAGGVNKVHGYRYIRIPGHEKFTAHRIAWLHHYGTPPVAWIDHINGNRDDNRIENLRDVAWSINSQNRRRASKNNRSTGVLGVSQAKPHHRPSAHIRVGDRLIRLGCFDTVEEAGAAYIEAKRQLHEGCTI